MRRLRSLGVALLAPLSGCGDPLPTPPQHLTEQACQEQHPGVTCRKTTALTSGGSGAHFVFIPQPWHPYQPSYAPVVAPSAPSFNRPSVPTVSAPSVARSGFGGTAVSMGAGAAAS
jgi:hypothetical protein